MSQHTHFEYEEFNWRKYRSFTAKGDSPADLCWPEHSLESDQRISERRESYRATFSVGADGGEFTTELDEATWRTLKVGRSYRLKVGLRPLVPPCQDPRSTPGGPGHLGDHTHCPQPGQSRAGSLRPRSSRFPRGPPGLRPARRSPLARAYRRGGRRHRFRAAGHREPDRLDDGARLRRPLPRSAACSLRWALHSHLDWTGRVILCETAVPPAGLAGGDLGGADPASPVPGPDDRVPGKL
jgi:hypothetical protein